MTIIAWDGTTLAADKQSTTVGYGATVTKIFRVRNGLLGIAGNGAHGMAIMRWINEGCDPDKWPKPVDEANSADCLFISNQREIFEFFGSSGAYPVQYEDRYNATGSGRDYALAAMYLGKTAREAVEVACALDVNCGKGIDTLELE